MFRVKPNQGLSQLGFLRDLGGFLVCFLGLGGIESMCFNTPSLCFDSESFFGMNKDFPSDPKQIELITYYTALGEFISVFSVIEYFIKILLYVESGVSPEVGRAVFSGVQSKNATECIKRIYAAQGETIDPILVETFKQYGLINSQRNDICHYGLDPLTDELTISNARAVHIESKISTFPISGDILYKMTEDLRTIGRRLEPFLLRKETTAENFISLRDAASRDPWLYKFPEPKETHRKNSDSGRE